MTGLCLLLGVWDPGDRSQALYQLRRVPVWLLLVLQSAWLGQEQFKGLFSSLEPVQVATSRRLEGVC